MRPDDDAAALEQLSHPGWYVVAGGIDLVRRPPTDLCGMVQLTELPGAHDIAYDPDQGLWIGAMVTHQEAGTSERVHEGVDGLQGLFARLGDARVRNQGTVVGNAVSAAPSYAVPPALVALRARLEIVTGAGRRQVDPRTWWEGSLRAETCFVTAVVVPSQPSTRRFRYHRRRLVTRRGPVEVGIAADLPVGPAPGAEPSTIVVAGLTPFPRRLPGLATSPGGDRHSEIAAVIADAFPAASNDPAATYLAATLARWVAQILDGAAASGHEPTEAL